MGSISLFTPYCMYSFKICYLGFGGFKKIFSRQWTDLCRIIFAKCCETKYCAATVTLTGGMRRRIRNKSVGWDTESWGMSTKLCIESQLNYQTAFPGRHYCTRWWTAQVRMSVSVQVEEANSGMCVVWVFSLEQSHGVFPWPHQKGWCDRNSCGWRYFKHK